MIISCIVAVSENGVIGHQNDLPWHLPADLKRFRALTTGHTIIMGRRTHESIGRPLPERRSIVISRDPGFTAPGVDVAGSLDEALARCSGEEEVFVIGGQRIFELALPRADRLYLTRVHAHVEGDVFFREDALAAFRLLREEHHDADERNPLALTFRVYERRSPGSPPLPT